MATLRPFIYGDPAYLDRLNDMLQVGWPRLLADPHDSTSAPVSLSAGRTLTFDDNGGCADVIASLTLAFDATTLADGWCVMVHVITGTATINVSAVGAFTDGTTSKTVTAGNAAIISSNGTSFRIMRMVAT